MDVEDEDNLPKAKQPRQQAKANWKDRRRVSKNTRDRRTDEWRRKKNATFEHEREQRNKRMLHVGVEEESDEIQRLISQTTTVERLAKQYQCSSRGVFLTVTKTWLALRQRYGQQVENLCPAIVACRAALLQFQLQYYLSWSNSELDTLAPQFQVRPVLSADLKDLISGYRWGFALTNIVISGMGRADVEGRSIWPVIPPLEVEDDETLVNPGLIVSSNLREFVVAMSPAGNAPVENRERVQNWNMFPNAVYDANHHITNPDAVCPANWPALNQAAADMAQFQALVSFARRKAPGCTSRIDYTGVGSGAAALTISASNDQSWGIVPNAVPEQVTVGASGRMLCSSDLKLEQHQIERGAISLLGECLDTDLWQSRYADQSILMLEYNWTTAVNSALGQTIS